MYFYSACVLEAIETQCAHITEPRLAEALSLSKQRPYVLPQCFNSPLSSLCCMLLQTDTSLQMPPSKTGAQPLQVHFYDVDGVYRNCTRQGRTIMLRYPPSAIKSVGATKSNHASSEDRCLCIFRGVVASEGREYCFARYSGFPNAKI